MTVIFLSEPVGTSGLLIKPSLSKKLAYYSDLDHAYDVCVPRSGGCFHPQFGLLPARDDEQGVKPKSPQRERPQRTRLWDFKTSKDLIDCQRETHHPHFDLYCGEVKEREGVAATSGGVQLWIDISTSMRRVDYSRDPNFCQRRLFVEKVKRDCSPVDISVFNTQLIPISDISRSCQLSGGNDTQRIIDWIKRNQSEHLIIVTDVDEINPQLMSFLSSIEAETLGDKYQKIFSTQLNELLPDILPSCSS